MGEGSLPGFVLPHARGRELEQPLLLPTLLPHHPPVSPTSSLPSFIVVRHLLELLCQIIEETHSEFQECLPLPPLWPGRRARSVATCL